MDHFMTSKYLGGKLNSTVEIFEEINVKGRVEIFEEVKVSSTVFQMFAVCSLVLDEFQYISTGRLVFLEGLAARCQGE